MIDQIYLLKLKSHAFPDRLYHQLESYFPSIPIQIHEVLGVSTGKNEGDMKLSTWDILSHQKPDRVAMDITHNHLIMMQRAFQPDHVQHVLFLEEDAILEKQDLFLRTWKKVCQSVSPFDILYLGYCNWPWLLSFYVSSCLVRPMSPLLAHAYIVSRSGYSKIQRYWTDILETKKEIHFDKLLGQIPSFQKLAVHPILAYQSKNPALMTKLTDQWNIHISNPRFLTVFHWISILGSFLMIFIIAWILSHGMFWLFQFKRVRRP